MSNNKKFAYISLFSSGGVGCYGFKLSGFDCVVTNELIERRLKVQEYNNKCKYKSGYILGDITDKNIKNKLFNEINKYKEKENINDIDVVIATPPCQGMSVANHKKSDKEINRNSLVIEAIKLVDEIKPKFFIFENVPAFMKTACSVNGDIKSIGQAIDDTLGEKYSYISRVLNFKNYGANSSRTRTLVIGVRSDLSHYISPVELFPDFQTEKNLRELIYNMPRLKQMGDIYEDDIYHSFKDYDERMRPWITELKEGESAFDNDDPLKRPHQVKNGKVIQNVSKNGDKYKRQIWDKTAPCIHTRNDILASQNTVHPEDDRVFSIRELMILMNIPVEFKWAPEDEDYLNNSTLDEKKTFLKKHEINIRQIIGEAVPTIILKQIADKISYALNFNNPNDKKLMDIISEYNLDETNNLHKFIKKNDLNLSLNVLSRLAELSNPSQGLTAAYYTDINTLTTIYKSLPEINKDEITILEPSVGTGNFIPFIIKKYESCKKINIDVCDINEESIETFKLLLKKYKLNNNIEINFINEDYLLKKFEKKYDLIIGNPPFINLSGDLLKEYRTLFKDNRANNSAAFFIEKALNMSEHVVMILPKYFLHNTNFEICREYVSCNAITSIIDFGENGFKGILIETICIFVNTSKRKGKTECVSITKKIKNKINQSKMCDTQFPNWLLYRNEFFDDVVNKLKFNIFTCYRDRQITNKYLVPNSDIWVIKSRNIKTDGSGIEHIKDYDSYMDRENLNKFVVSKYYERDDVFLSPNMTYYPRVVRKPRNTIVNGSVAIFELKEDLIITDDDLGYFASYEFRDFYAIARNYSTRTLNLDSNSIYYFGIRG